MVVVETNVLDHLVIVPQSLHERSRIADTRHGDHLLAVIQFLIHELREERPRPETFETGKVNTLIGDLNQNLAQDASVYRSHILRAFGHDEIMRPVQLFGQIPQIARRQHPIMLHGPCRIDHDDIDFRLYVTVLEAVVHHDEIDLRMLLPKTADPLCPFLAHDHDRIGKFALDLQRLVPHFAVVRFGSDLNISFRSPPVSSGINAT